MPERILTLLEAVREGLAEEMEHDPRVIVMGEDVGQLGGVFRATEGLLTRFGPERVVDTPMAELSIVGVAVGLAMRGLRPVAEIQFADFVHAAADQLINEAAKIRYRTGGDWTCPLVVRTAYGAGFRGGPYHSQSIEAFYCHVPGLKVLAPSFPADAKGLLTAAIRDPDPVLFLEHKLLYRSAKGPVPPGEHVVEIGRANVVREGDALTIVAYGRMLHEALAATAELARMGIDAEVLDLRTLLPLDRGAILESVAHTGRLMAVHEDTVTMGLGAEIVALVAEQLADTLHAAPVRVAMPDVGGIPVMDPLEDALIPNRHKIVDAAMQLFKKGPRRRREAPSSALAAEASSVLEVAIGEDHIDRLVAVVGQTCREFPICNAEFTWDGIRLHDLVRIEVILGEVTRSRDQATFTVIDFGVGSSLMGLPSVRPGQTAALWVGAVRHGSALLALAVDHRAVDGGTAGRFLWRVKELMEK